MALPSFPAAERARPGVCSVKKVSALLCAWAATDTSSLQNVNALQVMEDKIHFFSMQERHPANVALSNSFPSVSH